MNIHKENSKSIGIGATTQNKPTLLEHESLSAHTKAPSLALQTEAMVRISSHTAEWG